MSRSTSLGTKFGLVFALILAIVAWQVGSDAFQAFRTFSQIRTLDQQNAAANNLIAGVYEILMERLATNNALLADQPADSSMLSEIEKRRSDAVRKISAAQADLNQQEFPNKTALMGELNAAIEKANSYRAKADTAVKQRKAERDADTVKNLFTSLSELSATSQKVWGAVLTNVSQYDPELSRLSTLRLLSWNLRDIAGLERSHIAQAISAKGAIPDDKRAAIGEDRSRIALMWRLQEMYLKTNDHPAVLKGVQLAKEGYFGKFQPLAEQMRKISAEGAAYPMSVTQWVDTTTPQLFTLLEVMYGAGTASEAHTTAKKDAAILSLVFSLGLGLLAATILLGAALLVFRGVMGPLRRIQAAMLKLADGDFGVAVPGLERKDEVGAMAKAVERFKVVADEKARAGREKARAEAEAKAEQDRQTAAERAEQVRVEAEA